MTNIKQKAKELIENGLSYQEAADQLGISKSSAYRLVNENLDENLTDSKKNNKAPLPNLDVSTQLELKRLEFEHEQTMFKLKFETEKEKRKFDENCENLLFENRELVEINDELHSEIDELEIKVEELTEELETQSAVAELEYTIHEDLVNVCEWFIDKNNDDINSDEFNEKFSQYLTTKQEVIEHCLNNRVIYKEFNVYEPITELEPIFNEIKEEFENKGFFSSSYVTIQLADKTISILNNFLMI